MVLCLCVLDAQNMTWQAKCISSSQPGILLLRDYGIQYVSNNLMTFRSKGTELWNGERCVAAAGKILKSGTSSDQKARLNVDDGNLILVFLSPLYLYIWLEISLSWNEFVVLCLYSMVCWIKNSENVSKCATWKSLFLKLKLICMFRLRVLMKIESYNQFAAVI